MDGVPDSAVCNEAVKLAEKKGFAAEGICQWGVAHNCKKYGSDPLSGERKKSCIMAFHSLFYTGMMVKLWLSEYGAETVEKMLKDFWRNIRQ